MAQVESVEAGSTKHEEHTVHVKVSYLPAAHPFVHAYKESTPVAAVRTDAMKFFGVADRQERDTYRYFLEFGNRRIENLNTPLERFEPEHGHNRELRFNLTEEITPGSA